MMKGIPIGRVGGRDNREVIAGMARSYVWGGTGRGLMASGIIAGLWRLWLIV